MYRTVAVATLGVFLWAAALAGDSTPTTIPEDAEDLVGLTTMAKVKVPVRKSPPEGLLAWPGAQVGELYPDMSYRIEDAVVLPYVFWTQTWVLITDLDSGEELGWSYFGEDASQSVNFYWPHY